MTNLKRFISVVRSSWLISPTDTALFLSHMVQKRLDDVVRLGENYICDSLGFVPPAELLQILFAFS